MKPLHEVIINKKTNINPIWIMRQAGRYLPEYMEVRSNVNNFLDLCYNPELASKVTLQPIERFNFDSAIIFSDILVIPDALGIEVNFIKGVGPKLNKIDEQTNIKTYNDKDIEKHLKPVYDALKLTRKNLQKDKDLIGFSGSPWTLACYMIEGGGSKNFDSVKRCAVENETFFTELIEILSNKIIEHLSYQINSGANVVKLFDSWAGILPPKELRKWVINPNKKIAQKLKELHPDIPVICFPRGIGMMYEEFAKEVNCSGLAIDQTVERKWAKNNLQNTDKIVQGNLDNILLAFGSKEEIKTETLGVLEDFGDKNFVFNLGHGILPQTPIENVELVVDLVKNS